MSDIINLIIYAPTPCIDTGKLIDALLHQTLSCVNIYLCSSHTNAITDSLEKIYSEEDRFHFFLKTEEDRDLADTINRALSSVEEGFVQIIDSFVTPVSYTSYEEVLNIIKSEEAEFLILGDQGFKNHLSDNSIISCRLFREGFDGILTLDNLPVPIAVYIWLLRLSLLKEPVNADHALLLRNAPQSGFKPEKNLYFPEYVEAVDDILNTVSGLRPGIFDTVLKELFVLEARFYFMTCLSGFEVLKGHLGRHIENYYNISLAPEDIADYLYREYAIMENALKISGSHQKDSEHFQWMYNKEVALHTKEIAAKDKEIAAKDKEIAARDRDISSRDKEISNKEKQLAAKEREARHFEWMYNKEHAQFTKEQKRFDKELTAKEKEARHFEWLLKKETAAKLNLEKQNAQLSEKLDTAERRLSLRLVRVALKIHSFFRRFKKH